ncbi:very short patch repair endonuclease [Mangrovicoccus ximenensis]|uniref:very short patch repair endonuclease n=1 Tax=Mangrovicoccus ximenensis TaxID=1911570 RepID=UPI000D3D86D3|nr:very short patch repair endonuclease [Mangrovicoccus ximenensis]
MADTVTPEVRSRMMAAIRRKDTKPELALRRALHAAGFRFRVDVRKLPGSPDLVLRKWNTAVFVHGCFWHRHEGCPRASTPASRAEYWAAKFEGNVARDARNRSLLLEAGWRVATVWECGLLGAALEPTLEELTGFLTSGGGRAIELPAAPVIPGRRRPAKASLLPGSLRLGHPLDCPRAGNALGPVAGGPSRQMSVAV